MLARHINLHSELEVHSSRERTFWAAPSVSCIDLVISKNVLIEETRNYDNLCSDHIAIAFRVQASFSAPKSRSVHLDYKNANWLEFRTSLNYCTNICSEYNRTYEVDAAITKITEDIMNAARKYIPKIKLLSGAKPLPNTIRTAISARNAARRKYQQSRSNEDRAYYDLLASEASTLLVNHDNDCWQARLENLTTEHNNVWRLARARKRGKIGLDKVVLRNSKGEAITSSRGKVELMAQHYEKVFNPPTIEGGKPQVLSREDPAQSIEIADFVNNEIRNLPAVNILTEHCFSCPTVQEIRNTIRKIKRRSAPGMDGITPEILRALPPKILCQLYYIYLACFRLQYFPRQWRSAIIVSIHKTGKPKLEPDSYRPISLLPSLGKILERLIQARLNDLIDDSIRPEQFAFRPAHSSDLAVARTVDQILREKSLMHHSFLVCLDLKKAFDSVWHEGLLWKLANVHNLPIYLLKLLESFLSDRSFQASDGKTLSSSKSAKCGVPQGSPLSPLLFNSFINDLPDTQTIIRPRTSVQLSMYADDVAFVTSALKVSSARAAAQDYLTACHRFFEE